VAVTGIGKVHRAIREYLQAHFPSFAHVDEAVAHFASAARP
jgi:hypothetical protein